MIQKAIHELVENKNLDFETTKEVMDEIMSGNATQAQISSFLTALRMKGETIDEITACATVMRDKAVKLSPPFPVMDIVGTGGDEVGTSHVSPTVIRSAFWNVSLLNSRRNSCSFGPFVVIFLSGSLAI